MARRRVEGLPCSLVRSIYLVTATPANNSHEPPEAVVLGYLCSKRVRNVPAK